MNVFQLAIKSYISCLPCTGKIPNIRSWKQYMSRLPTHEEAEHWKGNLACICGKVSYGLTCVDFDEKNGETWDDWISDINHIKPELLGKLYMETTISGGYHVCYRSDSNMHNCKLACNKEGKGKIEIRGEGGYFVSAPSEGYNIYFGKLSTLQKISEAEENILLGCAESYNEYIVEEYQPKKHRTPTGDSVFNKYDSVTNPIPLLQKYGWTIDRCFNDKVYLRRPGKDKGVSASWNFIPNRFYCFSTSTVFKNEVPLTPSAIYTFLVHNGDFRAAAKEIQNNNAF